MWFLTKYSSGITAYKLMLKYRALPPSHRAVFFGLIATIPVLITAGISYYLKLSLDQAWHAQLAGFVLAFVFYTIVKRYLELRAEIADRKDERKRNALGQAQESLDGIIADRIARLHRCFAEYGRDQRDGTDLFEALLGSLSHIQTLVDSLYGVVQAQFGHAGSLLEEIDFEVTFMTESYVDEKITIYAYQNRDHRAPRSLLLRADEPDKYANTITAEIYRQAKPDMRIVTDTAAERYDVLYDGQLERIKSSIVYPVLSDRNELLGTIVVHCNESGFFQIADARFWRKLLELYAKRIAQAKLCLDIFARLDIQKWAASVNPTRLLPAN